MSKFPLMAVLAAMIALHGSGGTNAQMPAKKGPVVIPLPAAKAPVVHKLSKVVELEADVTVKGDSTLAKGTIFTAKWEPKGATAVVSGTKIDIPSVSKELTLDLSFPADNVLPKGTRVAPGSVLVLDADTKLPAPLVPFGAGAIKPGTSATTDELTTEALIRRAETGDLAGKATKASKDAETAKAKVEETATKLDNLDKASAKLTEMVLKRLGTVEQEAAEAKEQAKLARDEAKDAKRAAEEALAKVGTLDGRLTKAIEKFGSLSDKITELENGVSSVKSTADTAKGTAEDALTKAKAAKELADALGGDVKAALEVAKASGGDAKKAMEIAEAAGGDATKAKELASAPLEVRWTSDYGERTTHKGWTYERFRYCAGSYYDYRRVALVKE